MIYAAVIISWLAGCLAGAAAMCFFAGRKVTRAEIDRRERANRVRNTT